MAKGFTNIRDAFAPSPEFISRDNELIDILDDYLPSDVRHSIDNGLSLEQTIAAITLRKEKDLEDVAA